jgi:hypothetical protein
VAWKSAILRPTESLRFSCFAPMGMSPGPQTTQATQAVLSRRYRVGLVPGHRNSRLSCDDATVRPSRSVGRPAVRRIDWNAIGSRLIRAVFYDSPMSKASTTAVPRLGLRERKKMETRRVIAETARALFEQRGFDAVTVAEVADAANVSVKTLFTYFQSKEMSRISSRGSGNSFFEVVREPDTHPQTEPDTHPRKVGVCAS